MIAKRASRNDKRLVQSRDQANMDLVFVQPWNSSQFLCLYKNVLLQQQYVVLQVV